MISNIKEIFQKYIAIQKNSNIINYSFIYNSFNFRLFYFIIQNILSKNIFIENKIQIILKDLLLFLDKNNLNEDLNEFLDLNNLYEVNISSITDINDTQEFDINKNSNIIIKSSYIPGIDINQIINVFAVNIKNEKYLIDLTKDSNIIYKGIKKIIINYIKKDAELKNEFVIDFIPVKDEDKFIKYKENQDIKMVNLIEKSIILFLFNSYDKIQNLIDNYDKDKLVVNHAKLYQNEIFKYINGIKKDYKQDTKSELFAKSEQLVEEIKNIMKDEFNEFSIKYPPKDEIKEKENKKINNLTKDLIKYLEIYYSKAKKINLEKASIKNVKPLINKIFTIGLKYNDLDKKLEKLIEDINEKNINTEDLNINTEEIESIENFKEIFSLYKASFKMSSIYDIDKNKFLEDEFKKEIKKYQENIDIKLDFIDEVISSKTEQEKENNILPKLSIVDYIFILLKQLENIDIQDIKKYLEIKNINCNIMLKQFQLIKDLLSVINKEKNISLLLNLMNQKIRMNHNKGIINFDYIYGANYYLMEKLIKEFHEIIEIIYDIKENERRKLCNITKYELLESMLWKIKERDFDVVSKIIEIFEDITYFEKEKKEKKENNDNNEFDNKCLYNLKYFNKANEYKRKKEIFEILISQIFGLIKENIKLQKTNSYQTLLEKILNYFAEINSENPYYHDFILLFYKNVYNSKKMFELILSSKKNIFNKIMTIALSNNKNERDKDNINTHTKLIMLKLLYQILQAIDKEQLKNSLLSYFKTQDNKIQNDINIFEYLFNLIFNKLKNEKSEGKIIKRYYHRLLIICLNKLLEEKNDLDKLNKNDDILNLLFTNYFIGISENNYKINSSEGKIFENNALYNSDKEILLNSGKIICFLDSNNSFENYISDNDKMDFDKNDFKFYTEIDKVENNQFCGFVLSDDALNSEFFKINSINYMENIILQENIENNKQTAFINNNPELIIKKILIAKLPQLNDKGKYLALRIIKNTLNQLNKEEIKEILKIIYDYYSTNKTLENTYKFLSLEYIEEKINIILNTYISNNKNIFTEENKDKDITNLFNFYINGKSLGLSLKSSDKIKWYNGGLNIPVSSEEIKNIYQNINVQNISFYKCNELKEEIEIKNEESILFVNEIKDNEDLNKIFEEIKDKKVKALLVKEIFANEEDLIKFIKDKNLPIYEINKSYFNKFIDFFTKGFGGNYININNYETELENSSGIVNIFNLSNLKMPNEEDWGEYVGEEIDINEKNKIKKYNELIEYPLNFYCLGNLKLIKRLIFDILCLDSINFEEIKQELSINEDDILYILEKLNLEYYFNIKNSLPNDILKKKLIKYLSTFYSQWLSKYFSKYIDIKFDQILSYDDYLNLFNTSGNNNEEIIYENNFGKYNNIIYDKLLFVLKNCINNSYKADLFVEQYFIIIKKILENKIKLMKDVNSRFYGYYDNDEEEIKKKDENDYFEETFTFEVFKILYKYMINNYNKENFELFKNCFKKSEIDIKMKTLIEKKIDLEEFFSERSRNIIKKDEILTMQLIFIYFDFCLILFFREEDEGNYFKYWMKSRHKLFLFYQNYKLLSTEKYYNENDFREIFSLIAYISDSSDCFFPKSASSGSNDKNVFNMKFSQFNEYIKEIKDKKGDEIITSFSVDFGKQNDVKINYNKLAVFVMDNNTKENEKPKYILQEIIDIQELKRKKIDYKMKFPQDKIYLVPLNNIKTYLYGFGYNYNNSLGINGSFAKFYDEPTKCMGLSNYSWNFSYGQNYCLSLDEVESKVYSSGSGKGAGLNSIPQKQFIKENNKINILEKYKIIDIATGDCTTSVMLTQNGDLYGIGKNETNFLRIKNLEKKTSLKSPILLQIKNNIKVVSMSIGYKNCFVINNFGELYGIGDNTRGQITNDLDEKIEEWTKIELPEGCKRFLQCANGDRYLICLIEDHKGNGKIYARGINRNHECGIKNDEERYISDFTQCDETTGLNFKSIYTRNNRSAAITTTGQLYIWGQKIVTNYMNTLKNNDEESFNSDKKRKNEEDEEKDIPCPTLVEFDPSIKNAIIDHAAISNTHILAIGRCLENGNYVKKLFSCGNNKKGALGLKIKSFNDKNMVNKLKEVKVIDKDNEKSNLIPIKLSIGVHRSFVLCVDENELIEEIKNKEKNSVIDFQIKINNYLEESSEEKLKQFYKSDEIFGKYLNYFGALTNQNYIDFVSVMEKLKTEYRILTTNIYYNEFLNYLNNQKNVYDFLMIFGLGLDNKRIIEQEKESIFNYLKTRMKTVENNIMNYCLINKRSEYKPFLQKIIVNNIIYLPNKIRSENFDDLLNKIPRFNGELKTIKVDRFKAKAFYAKYNESYQKIKDFELDETIFGQVFNLMKNKNPNEYFLDKNSRLFRVVLQNEHAVDSGGPYHDVISNICEELQSDYIDILIKTPNNRINYDLLNDKYIINPNSYRSIYNEAFEFLGKLMASSISTGEFLDLNLHPVIWKNILSKEITLYDYESIDYYFYTAINNLEYISNISDENKKKKELEKYGELYFIIKNSNDVDIELKPEGSKIKVTIDNLKEYIDLSKSKRIKEFNNSLDYLKKGFYSVIPYDILQVLTWQQLEEMVCGTNELNIDEFKANTVYEGYTMNDQNIKWFWDWFESTSKNERIKYLKFVSGRSRLPKSGNVIKYKHTISKLINVDKNRFPKSMTCFFKLNLPVYDSYDTFVEKMKYAIIYCYEIDTDQ